MAASASGNCCLMLFSVASSVSSDAESSPAMFCANGAAPPLECSTRRPPCLMPTARISVTVSLFTPLGVVVGAVTTTGGNARSKAVRFVITAPVYVRRLKNTIEVRMSTNGTRLIRPCAVSGSRSRWRARSL